jgi:YidC/Oxa1 family membrane protein insertase
MDKRTLLFIFCSTLAFYGVNAFYEKYDKKKPAPVTKQEVVLPKRVEKPQALPVQENTQETFYVLENDYQQLVFTNKGGSIAEINLPLKTNNEKSLVKEIAFDQAIVEKSSNNARFPLQPYRTYDGKTNEGKLGGYYPLLRRGIDGKAIPAEYYAMNITSTDPAIANTTFKVTRFEKDLIQFEGTINGNTIVKTYNIPSEKAGPYCFELNIQTSANSSDLWLCSGIPDVEIVSNSYSPVIRTQSLNQHNLPEVDTVSLPQKGIVQQANKTLNWISNSNGFLGLLINPITKIDPGYKTVRIEGAEVPTRLTLVDPKYASYPAANYPGYTTYLPLKEGSSSFRIFAGPYDAKLLAQIDQTYTDSNANTPEYSSAVSIEGWFSFISQPFAKFLEFLMGIFYSLTHSWAASIILLTIALRVMMFPLNNWSITSSMKMQQLSPKIKAIQERYKNDPRKAQMEVMNLYKESGANPLVGCLPALLQAPFLMGMFYLLKSSFPLRGASFIPGWIDDLSAPDVLFRWDQPIWLIGNELHLLPILMGLTMYLQQKFTAKLPKDKSKLTDAQKQQKTMGVMMAVLFTVMFYNFPSGLNIYFMLSTLLGVCQQWWVTRNMQAGKQQG